MFILHFAHLCLSAIDFYLRTLRFQGHTQLDEFTSLIFPPRPTVLDNVYVQIVNI